MAISLVVLLGFAALVVDLGAVHKADAELEACVDAAALAGASHIDESAAGLEAARRAAQAVASENAVRQVPVDADDLELVFGTWSPDTGVFAPSSNVAAINALRVSAEVRDIPTPFAGAAFGLGFADAEAEATAVRPPPEPVGEVDCFLPLAIPMCRYEQVEAGTLPSVGSYRMANDTVDNIGWAHPDGANARNVRTALDKAASGRCYDDDTTIALGDPIPLSNGVLAGEIRTTRRLLMESGDPWDYGLWGPKPEADENSLLPVGAYGGMGVVQGPLVVFDEGEQSCGAVKFNQSAPMERFAWAVIFDVYAGPQSHKGLQILLDLEHEFEEPGSGSGSGTVVDRPPGRLVR